MTAIQLLALKGIGAIKRGAVQARMYGAFFCGKEGMIERKTCSATGLVPEGGETGRERVEGCYFPAGIVPALFPAVRRACLCDRGGEHGRRRGRHGAGDQPEQMDAGV